MKILIIDPLHDGDPDIERAAAGPDVELVFRRSHDGALADPSDYAEADGVLNSRSLHRLPASAIAKLTRCRAIQQGGVGFNHIDLVAAAKRGIVVMNTPDYGTTEVANHAVALALGLLRGVQAYDRRLRRSNGAWDAREIGLVRRLTGLRCGIVGLGRIGTAAALRFKALGMEVTFFDPHLPVGHEIALALHRAESLDDLLPRSDLLSLHCPLNERTWHMIDDAALARLPEGAVLVNTARGGVVDFQALSRALGSGRLGGAGLDVFEQEPLDRADPLIAAWANNEPWLDDRLILTPHAGFYSPASVADIRRLSVGYLASFLRTGRKPTCVNLEELRAYGPRDAA